MAKVRYHGNGVSFQYSADELHKLRLLRERYGSYEAAIKAGALLRVDPHETKPIPSRPWWKKWFAKRG